MINVMTRPTFGFTTGIAVMMVFCMCGCLTQHVGWWITDAKQYSAEFIMSDYELPQFRIKGSYTGIVNRDGMEYLEYRFKGVLGGDSSRQLVILIEKERGQGPKHVIVSESSDVAHESEPAELHLLWDYTVARVARRDDRRHKDALETMNKKYPYCLFIGECAPHQLIASFCEADAPPAVYFLPLESRGVGGQWEYASADIELEWNVRSRVGYYLLHLNYAWATPVDVVTFPLLVLYFMIPGVSVG